MGAITSAITLFDATTLEDFRFWVVGSLTRANGTSLTAVAPFIAAGICAAIVTSRTLNVLALGDRLWSARLAAALAVVLLAGGATAIARTDRLHRAGGPAHRAIDRPVRTTAGIVAWTVVLAPTLLLLADILGRILVSPQQLQVGIVTGLAGAPVFLYLVRNRKVSGL